jgi:signal transduction histidine kinase
VPTVLAVQPGTRAGWPSRTSRGAVHSIEVTDSGRGGGATGTGTGYGITGMRERAALLGGDFSAGPRPGGGFRVAARLPLLPPAPAR